jgi:hypothetical protein
MGQRLSATHETQLHPKVLFEQRSGQFTWFQACRRNQTLLGILRSGYPKAVSNRIGIYRFSRNAVAIVLGRA